MSFWGIEHTCWSTARLRAVLMLFLVSFLSAEVRSQNQQQLETIRRIKNNELVFGSWIYLTDPVVTEIIGDAGFDFVIFDLEHGRLDENITYNMLLALGDTACVPITRVAANHPDLIKKALEAGALGVMVPWINNHAEAERAVRAAKYPPQGERGLDYGRGQKWGKAYGQYYKSANDFILVILIIDSRQGVENIEEILRVPGIDVVLPGVFDLSGAYGVPGEFNHPLVLDAVERIVASAKAHGISIAAFATDAESIERKVKQGARFIELTVDTDLLWQGAERILKTAKAVGEAQKLQ